VLLRVLMMAATLGWAASEILRRRPASAGAARALFTAALIVTLAHVVLAFEWVYAWDHAAAVRATAQGAADRVGWGWRGSLYVNYLFLGLWLADASWWWMAPASYRRRTPGCELARAAIFVFMFFNAAVVFATPAGRLVGVCAVGVVLIDAVFPRRRIASA
jgi:hypothetical protein